jgi:hypothetical protein
VKVLLHCVLPVSISVMKTHRAWPGPRYVLCNVHTGKPWNIASQFGVCVANCKSLSRFCMYGPNTFSTIQTISQVEDVNAPEEENQGQSRPFLIANLSVKQVRGSTAMLEVIVFPTDVNSELFCDTTGTSNEEPYPNFRLRYSSCSHHSRIWRQSMRFPAPRM